ncbi:MAG: DUF3078 domain-containing protein [Bacteroidia bacterium]|nr:DUF3078 domain-containing protein [Bacteroidia bacterium]
MKKILSIIGIGLLFSAYSKNLSDNDTTKIWKSSGFVGINFSQTALSNWQGGGQDNVAFNSVLDYQIIYKKNKHTWLNKWYGNYGLMRTGSDKLFKKNADQLLFISKYNLDAWNKFFFYSAMLDFRTQFAPGYNYKGDSIIGRAISDFFSPAYLQLAIGIDYKSVEYFSMTLSPLAGKMTFVSRQYLADAGAYGVEKAEYDPNTGMLVKAGKKIRGEFGGRLTFRLKKDLNKVVSWDAYLDLFSNYLKNPQNIDVVFNSLITIKLTKIFTITIMNQMLYDDDVKIIRDWNKDGKYDNPNDINGPRLQILSTFGIGLGYKF